ncbi:hypothetical protein SVIOM342S_00268 [Streptomyces violaceorubidus]
MESATTPATNCSPCHATLSRRAHETFTRYAHGQRHKLDAHARTHGAPR